MCWVLVIAVDRPIPDRVRRIVNETGWWLHEWKKGGLVNSLLENGKMKQVYGLLRGGCSCDLLNGTDVFPFREVLYGLGNAGIRCYAVWHMCKGKVEREQVILRGKRLLSSDEFAALPLLEEDVLYKIVESWDVR
jgi:hypothetical protein